MLQKKEHWDKALAWWKSLRSDENSIYDDVIKLDASKVEPTVTWGITPGQSVGINQQIPLLDDLSQNDKLVAEEAYEYMSFEPGQLIKGTSCLLYTSPSPRDISGSRMPSSA